MKELLSIGAVVVAWFVLYRWVLPALGAKT